ncbi:Ig-like domain-containing protein [Pseudoneobacillus sp. C159]
MRSISRLLIFLLFFQCFSFGGLVTAAVSWGDTKQANYDTSIPGTGIFWSDPLGQGGMNLSTGKMTRGKDADIAFSLDGNNMGANAIVDLGEVDFTNVDGNQEIGYLTMVDAVPGHVYLIKRANGSLAKLKMIQYSNSIISLEYALVGSPSSDTATLSSIKIGQTLKYNANPVALKVVATFSNKKTAEIKSDAVTWKSSNTNVANISSKGVVTFTGKPGKVTITATYQGKTASVTTTVGNVVKSLTTATKLAYSNKPVKIVLTATYADGKKQTVQTGVVWKSSNTAVAKVTSTGIVTFTGQNGTVTITASYQGTTASFKTTVSLKQDQTKEYAKLHGKWKLWIPGSMLEYFYKDTGKYAGGEYTKGASNGALTINKDGTYLLNGKKEKWRVAKAGEVYNHPISIILPKASEDGHDIAVTFHDSKKGYIKLMWDSKGTYTDGSKIWIFSSEGYK